MNQKANLLNYKYFVSNSLILYFIDEFKNMINYYKYYKYYKYKYNFSFCINIINNIYYILYII